MPRGAVGLPVVPFRTTVDQAIHAPRALGATLHGIINDPVFAGARFGIAVRDVITAQPVCEWNAGEIFYGASTTKILTCAFALALLGPDFRFRTRLVRRGELDEAGTLHGDLVLVAAGDPNFSDRVVSRDHLSLETRDRSDEAAVAQGAHHHSLKVIEGFARSAYESGIRCVTGTVLVDTHLFAEGDRDIGIGGTISPIAVNDNLINIEVCGGDRPGDPLRYRMSPINGYVSLVDRGTTGESDSESTLILSSEQRESIGTWSIIISGTAPSGKVTHCTVVVAQPSRWARTLLVEALAAAGVVVQGSLFGPSVTASPTPVDTIVVAEHVSPRLREATKVMLKVSQNLHAEMLIPVIGATVRGARGANARPAGYACCAELLTKWDVDATGLFQGDACGAYGHFSPDFMCRFLVRIASTDIYAPFLEALPIMGRDGTLRDIQAHSPGAGQIFAKTGTYELLDPLLGTILVRCKGLAGYVNARSGRRLAFTLYLSNLCYPRSSKVNPGQVLGEMANAIYEHL